MVEDVQSVNNEAPNEAENQAPMGDGVAFELDADDPRRVDNRGGLAVTTGAATEVSADDDGSGEGVAHVSITGANVADDVTDTDDTGATGSGRSNSGQLNLSTTGMVASDTGPAEVGPIEDSASGAVAPQVEITDVGLVDVNAADMSLPDDEQEGAGARVEDEEGNPL